MKNIDENYQILENLIFSKEPNIEFVKEYKSNCLFKEYIDGFLPEINDCFKQEQRSVWHLYTVMEHTLIALKRANELTENFTYSQKRVVLFAVFFHDIGKPKSVVEKVNSKGEIYYGFPNHNLKSIEIFKRVKGRLYLSEKECDLIENLILNHDTFNDEIRPINQFLYNEKLNEIIGKIDKSDIDFYFKSLVIVAKSDNFAQNQQKTKSTLNKIIAFENLLK